MGSMPQMPSSPPPKLLIHAIEEKVKWTPNDTFMRYPRLGWETRGYDIISWTEYANAINKVAFWLDEKLGSATDIDTFAYLGPSDPRYAIIVPAAIKSGRKILIPDGRITVKGLKGLVQASDCKAWMSAEDGEESSLVDEVAHLPKFALPSLDWMLDSETQTRYPYEKTFAEAKNEVIVIIHTSGTTGVPKPIRHTNGFWSAMGNALGPSQRHYPRGTALDFWKGRSALNCCAPQWLAGLHFMIISPAFLDSPCIMLPPAISNPSPANFKKILEINNVAGLKCAPHTIATLYEDPEARQLLRSLEYVAFGGAALDRSVGDDLCQSTRLVSFVGSTESGAQVSFNPVDRNLWYTFDFVPEMGGTMVPLDSNDGDGLHELIFEQPKTGGENFYQPGFWNPAHTDLDRIETKELYTPILDLDGKKRWVFAARKDDLTKLSWLAKFHAQDVEVRIQQHPDVKSVCVGGEGRPAPYVIIEVKEGALDRESEHQLLDRLYATVVAGTNASDIDEIRIPRETLIIAKPDKPFKRNTFKHGVIRKEVEKDYSEEIEEAYSLLQASTKPTK